MTSAAATSRLPLLVLGAGALVTGIWSGLLRLGAVPVAPVPALAHGPLMVCGFLGTVIALERAVAAQSRWALLGPLACGAGAALLATGQTGLAAWAFCLGSAVVAAVTLGVARAHPALHHVVLLLAAAGWVGGNVLFALGRPLPEVVPLWLLFLVGTIAAERLELNRLLPVTAGARAAFVVSLGLFGSGALLGLAAPDLGMRLLGLGAVALAVWLLRFDLARRTLKQAGQVRFIAVALLGGYAWLAVFGALALWLGNPLAGPAWDALLHAVFLGFVFSMIFGHALIILPAVAGVRVPFKARFYLHLLLLHASLVVRLAGDGLEHALLRRAGAWAGAAAIALFLVSTFTAVLFRPSPKKELLPWPASH